MNMMMIAVNMMMIPAAGALLYVLMVLICIFDFARSHAAKTDPDKSGLAALPDRFRERVERSMRMLESHPDLRNQLGLAVADRYAGQIAVITQRYHAASDSPDGIRRASDGRATRSDTLLDQGLSMIERKIDEALAVKGEGAREELDVYVRFLHEAD